MSPADQHGRRNQMRQSLTHLAARLMAEDGSLDYSAAKRKAARQLGAPDTHNLPANSEIERELRAYQALYQRDEQSGQLRRLREDALQAMQLLERFDPHLAGSVLDGTASRHSNINIHLFPDSVKEVEMFLLNQAIPYESAERRFRYGDDFRPVPTFLLDGEHAQIELAVFEPGDLRQAPRGPIAGRAMERARISQVETLIALG